MPRILVEPKCGTEAYHRWRRLLHLDKRYNYNMVTGYLARLLSRATSHHQKTLLSPGPVGHGPPLCTRESDISAVKGDTMYLFLLLNGNSNFMTHAAVRGAVSPNSAANRK